MSIIRRIKTLTELNRYEIWWILTHPLRAYPVWKISIQVREIANRHITDPELDGDYAGGQVDALRHILWMALITQRYGARFARKLGLTHEKSNKLDFKKRKLEEYQLPDAASMMMDLYNNEIGIDLGSHLPKLPVEELVGEVKKLVLNGKAWVIKKDKDGNFLDVNGQIISKSLWLGKWNTPKVLVHSDFRNKFFVKEDLPDFRQKQKRQFNRNYRNSKPNKVTSSKSL